MKKPESIPFMSCDDMLLTPSCGPLHKEYLLQVGWYNHNRHISLMPIWRRLWYALVPTVYKRPDYRDWSEYTDSNALISYYKSKGFMK